MGRRHAEVAWSSVRGFRTDVESTVSQPTTVARYTKPSLSTFPVNDNRPRENFVDCGISTHYEPV